MTTLNEQITALLGTIESQKQTHDALIKKLQDLEKEQIVLMEEQKETYEMYLKETKTRDEKLQKAVEGLEEIANFVTPSGTRLGVACRGCDRGAIARRVLKSIRSHKAA